MKNIRSIFLLLMLLTVLRSEAQPYIGRHAGDVKQYIRTHQREFSLDQTTRNTAYRYLKFVDQMGYKTLLVFLSDQDTCSWYKIVYDADLYDSIVESLDTCCKRESDTSWIEVIGDEHYRKVLKKTDWFFSVTTRPAGESGGRK
ncbi:MAG: hypothetical protein GXO83_13440 [Chlorobi bacterium]|nr:hypothetical protein [Chlorobiota bacterium]